MSRRWDRSLVLKVVQLAADMHRSFQWRISTSILPVISTRSAQQTTCWQRCWTIISIRGNALRIDPKRITWKRVVDMNDRQLRNIVDGLGRRVDGVTREDGYDITVASEIMAVCAWHATLRI